MRSSVCVNIFLLKTIRWISFFDHIINISFSKQPSWYVDRCPKDEEEWKKRVEMRFCDVSAIKDAIKKIILYPYLRRKTHYHCALTGDGDRLVEVCAPSVHIHGTYNHPYHTPITCFLIILAESSRELF